MNETKNFNKDIYTQFISNVQMKSIKLSSLSLHDVQKDNNFTDLVVNVGLNTDKHIVNDTTLSVFSKFIVTVTNNKETSEEEKEFASEVAFIVEFQYSLEYTIKDLKSYDREYIETFVKRNVPINAWPYARELVSSITTRMGFPTLLLDPLTNVG